MKENNKRYALILAGGKGSRLWPISTTNKPKPVSYTHQTLPTT